MLRNPKRDRGDVSLEKSIFTDVVAAIVSVTALFTKALIYEIAFKQS